MHHLVDDLFLSFWTRKELVKNFFVALNASLKVLEALFSPVEDGLYEDRSILDDIQKLLARLLGEKSICN